MFKVLFNSSLGKILLAAIFIILLILSMMYLNSRWSRIRDIRRKADAESIIKALLFYQNLNDEFPFNIDNDGDGWDNSNDSSDRTFLEPLIKAGTMSAEPFDPKNNEEYYYRYQWFPATSYGCRRPFVVFQVMGFETEGFNIGEGKCDDIDFTQLAPAGYTWLEYE